jgi:hypothetical protein
VTGSRQGVAVGLVVGVAGKDVEGREVGVDVDVGIEGVDETPGSAGVRLATGKGVDLVGVGFSGVFVGVHVPSCSVGTGGRGVGVSDAIGGVGGQGSGGRKVTRARVQVTMARRARLAAVRMSQSVMVKSVGFIGGSLLFVGG